MGRVPTRYAYHVAFRLLIDPRKEGNARTLVRRELDSFEDVEALRDCVVRSVDDEVTRDQVVILGWARLPGSDVYDGTYDPA